MIFRTPQTETIALIDDLNLIEDQKNQILMDRHDSKVVGHLGINKTIELITRDFKWPSLRKDVEQYIRNYNTYAKVKHPRHKLYGLL